MADRNFGCAQSFASFNNNILDDRQFNVDSKNEINLPNDFNRLIGVQPESKVDNVSELFRNMPIVSSKKTNLYNINICSNISKSNNLLAMKMVTFYQYMIQNNQFVCSPIGLLNALLLFYVGLNKLSMAQIEESLIINNQLNIYNELQQLHNIFSKSNSVQCNNIMLLNGITLSNQYNDKIENMVHIDHINGQTVNRVNDWINKQTNGQITNVLNQNIDNLALINVLYFKSNWKISFDKNKTRNKEFYTIENTTMCQMMYLYNEKFNYYENDKYQLIELPLSDKDIVMGFLLEYDYNKIIIPPTDKTLLNNISKMVLTQCNVEIPKFTAETSIISNDLLKFIGINKIFTNADCSEMIENNKNNIFVDTILQKTKIIVSEEGTDTIKNAQYLGTDTNNTINFIANHPFIYYIRHAPTNIILFIGKKQ